MSGVVVLIPIHNGGPNVTAVLEGLGALPVRRLVVDDGSTDGSGERARAAGAEVLPLRRRCGKGAALRHGLARILAENERPDWIVFMDGDGQHLPSEVPRFLARMDGGADLLLGTRMDQGERIPAARRRVNNAGSFVLRLMTGHAVPDTQCGFRAIRAAFAARLGLESDGYEIETEMLMKALRLGARWESVPVSAVYEGEPSHFRPVADTYRICMAALRHVR